MRTKLQQLERSKSVQIVVLICCFLILWLLILQFLFPPKFIQYSLDRELPKVDRGQWSWFSYNKIVKKAPRKVIKKSRIVADLVGLIRTDERRVALITTKNKPLGVYAEGSQIEAGFILKLIEHDRVIIDENGEERELLMKKNINSLLREQTEQDSQEEKGNKRLNGKSIIGNSQISNVQKIENNQFSQFVDVYKVKVSDENEGLFLKDIDDFVSEISGIKPSDILVDVDGQSVFDIINNTPVIMELLNKESVSVSVVRNGQQQQLNINVKDISSKLLPLLNR